MLISSTSRPRWRAGILRPIRHVLRPARNFILKYFSEVGYCRRWLHWHLNRLEEREEIARRTALATKIRLDEYQGTLLDAIRRTGLAKARLDTLCGDAGLLPYLKALASAFGTPSFEDVARLRSGASKYYWADMWSSPADGSDPLLDFACHPRILSIVAAYLGQVPILQDVRFFYSPVNTGKSTSAIGSQGWHLDTDQETRAKIFLSPFTIAARNGPTTCLPAPHSDKRLYDNYPGYFGDEQALKAGLRIENRIALLTEPGEFHFADTNRLFHFGSRDVAEPRWLVIITYGPVKCYLRPRNRRMLYGPSNRFAVQNRRILAAFEELAPKA
jgi:hypothetical protein